MHKDRSAHDFSLPSHERVKRELHWQARQLSKDATMICKELAGCEQQVISFLANILSQREAVS